MPRTEGGKKKEKKKIGSKYQMYRVRKKREVNKEKKIQRHLKRHPNDQQSRKALGNVWKEKESESKVRRFSA